METLYRGDPDEYTLSPPADLELTTSHKVSWALAPRDKAWRDAKVKAQSDDPSIIIEDDPDNAGAKRIRIQVSRERSAALDRGQHYLSVQVANAAGSVLGTVQYSTVIDVRDTAAAGAPAFS